MSMLMFSKDMELSKENLQVQIKGKSCACKTCTQESSYPSSRWLSSRNQWSFQTRSVRESETFHWMGELFCYTYERCFHGQWKFPCSTSSDQEEATNQFRPKRSKWSIGTWALLLQICGWANRKIPWMYSILHSRHEERLLDSDTSPGFKASNLHVNRHWKIPMDTASSETGVASDVFQKKLDEIFHNVPGVTWIADDVVIYGRSIEEHDKHFLNFLSIVRKNNVKQNLT